MPVIMRLNVLTFFVLFLGINFSLPVWSQPAPYPDNSWDLDTYEYLNIPPIHTKWTTTDLKVFVKYMEMIYQTDKWSLPRKSSPWSGKLFQKMTNNALFAPIHDGNLSIDERIEYINTLLDYGNFITTIYEEANEPHERFGAEVLSCYAFLSQTAVEVRIFMDALQAALPDHIVQQASFQKMFNQSTNQMVAIIELALGKLETEQSRFAAQDVEIFTQAIYMLIEKNWTIIPIDKQKAMIATSKAIIKTSNKDVQKMIKSFMKRLD